MSNKNPPLVPTRFLQGATSYTIILVLNLGSEMVFVVAQRLQAQNISVERTNLVLDEIISVLISKQLTIDLMKPQTTFNHEAVRDIIEDVAQSSAMRLDTASMDKLWDLISMVFKWQISVCDDVIKITSRHLYEIENYVTKPDTQVQLHKVQNLVENFTKILSSEEKCDLREDLLYWLKDNNVRVSLLLKMGLQSFDGQFVTSDLNPIAAEMLKNLGENIYAVTDNGKILENCATAGLQQHGIKGYPWEYQGHQEEPEVNELQLFVDQILGSDRKSSFVLENQALRLCIEDPTKSNGNIINNNDTNNSNDDETSNKTDGKNRNLAGAFDSIQVETTVDQEISKLIDDLGLANEKTEDSFLKDDLLNMIGGEDVSAD